MNKIIIIILFFFDENEIDKNSYNFLPKDGVFVIVYVFPLLSFVIKLSMKIIIFGVSLKI